MSMAACGFALLFCYKLRTKYSPVTMGEDEVTVMLETLHEVASGWLRRPLRAVVQSVLRDVTLHMELSSVAGGRRLFGLLPATDGVPHDLQASKLKVRAKAIVDELAVLGGDAPPALLQSLHFLTSRRINWPSNALYTSERAALHMAASGASSITATSPRVLTVGLLLTRTLLHRLLLQPREAMLAPKTTPRGMANLRMIAAMLYVLGCAVPLMPLRPDPLPLRPDEAPPAMASERRRALVIGAASRAAVSSSRACCCALKCMAHVRQKAPPHVCGGGSVVESIERVGGETMNTRTTRAIFFCLRLLVQKGVYNNLSDPKSYTGNIGAP